MLLDRITIAEESFFSVAINTGELLYLNTPDFQYEPYDTSE